MGLDLYAGPLTRYYAGNWETIIERWGAETGTAVSIVHRREFWWRRWLRPAGEAGGRPGEEAVRIWRERLAQGTADLAEEEWEWPESAEGASGVR